MIAQGHSKPFIMYTVRHLLVFFRFTRVHSEQYIYPAISRNMVNMHGLWLFHPNFSFFFPVELGALPVCPRRWSRLLVIYCFQREYTVSLVLWILAIVSTASKHLVYSTRYLLVEGHTWQLGHQAHPIKVTSDQPVTYFLLLIIRRLDHVNSSYLQFPSLPFLLNLISIWTKLRFSYQQALPSSRAGCRDYRTPTFWKRTTTRFEEKYINCVEKLLSSISILHSLYTKFFFKQNLFTRMRYLAFLFLAFNGLTFVNAHSWVDDLKVTGGEGLINGTLGYIRGYRKWL